MFINCVRVDCVPNIDVKDLNLDKFTRVFTTEKKGGLYKTTRFTAKIFLSGQLHIFIKFDIKFCLDNIYEIAEILKSRINQCKEKKIDYYTLKLVNIQSSDHCPPSFDIKKIVIKPPFQQLWASEFSYEPAVPVTSIGDLNSVSFVNLTADHCTVKITLKGSITVIANSINTFVNIVPNLKDIVHNACNNTN
jgi:hypothetical protein